MQDRPADFDSFVAQSTDTLMRTAYLIVWDLPEAEDLVQETLLKVARRWHRVRRMERPVAYARRMLVNLALGGAARHGRRRRELTGEALPDRPDPAAGDAPPIEANDELLRALGGAAAAPAHGSRAPLLPGSSRSRGCGRHEVLPRHRQEHGRSGTRATRADAAHDQ